MSSGGSDVHTTQPPKGSFCGTPSRVTSARPAPEAPMERSETPWPVALVETLLLRRNKESPGTWPSDTSSCGAICNCCSSSSVVEKAAFPTGSGGRAVIRTVSGAVFSPAKAAGESADRIATAGQAPRECQERNSNLAMHIPHGWHGLCRAADYVCNFKHRTQGAAAPQLL